MKPVFFLLLIVWAFHAPPARSQSVRVVKFSELQSMVGQANDTLYVINFWATWCVPCIKEMPEFEAVRRANAGKKVKVLLVSMDDKNDLKTRVVPFVRNRKIGSQVVLLDETDASTWIDKIAPEWSGALPMTLIMNNNEKVRRYIDKPVKPGELVTIINQYKPE